MLINEWESTVYGLLRKVQEETKFGNPKEITRNIKKLAKEKFKPLVKINEN